MRDEFEPVEKNRSSDSIHTDIAVLLSQRYESIYYVNILDDSYLEFNSTSGYQKLPITTTGHHFFEESRNNCKLAAYKDDVEMLRSFLIKEKILKELENGPVITKEYRLMVGGVPTYHQMNILRYSENSNYIVVAVENIDEAVRKDREKQRQLEENLSVIQTLAYTYSSVFYLNLNDGTAIPYMIDPDAEKLLDLKTEQKAAFEPIFARFVDLCVYHEDQQKTLAAGKMETIREKLTNEKTYSVVYRGIKSGTPLFCEMKFVRVDDANDEPTYVVGGFGERDSEISIRYVDENIRDDFSSIFLIDLESHKFRVIRKSKMPEFASIDEGNDPGIFKKYVEMVSPNYREKWAGMLDEDYLKQYLAKDDRCYRKAIPFDESYAMIMRGECGAFSEKILTCFTNCLEDFKLHAMDPKAFSESDAMIESRTLIKAKEQQKALREAVNTLNEVTQVPDAIRKLLEITARYYDADHACLFELDSDPDTVHCTFEHTRDGEIPLMKRLQEIPAFTILPWQADYERTGAVIISDAKDIERIFGITNIEKVIIIPTIEDGVITNFIGVDNPKKFAEDLSVLKTVSTLVHGELLSRLQLSEQISKYFSANGLGADDLTLSIISHLAGDFECLNYVKLGETIEDDVTLENLQMTESFRSVLPEWETELNLVKRFRILVNNFVYQPDRERFLNETNRRVILDALNREGVYYVNFRARVGDRISYYQLKYTADKRDNILHGFTFGILNQDRTRANEYALEDQLAVIGTISSDYDFLCSLNAETMDIHVYHAEEWLSDMFHNINDIVVSPEARDATLKGIVHPEDFDAFAYGSRHEVVMENLRKNHGVYHVNYRAYKFGEMIYYQTRYTVDRNNPKRIIIGLHSIDDHVRTEMRKREERFREEKEKLYKDFRQSARPEATDSLTEIGNVAAYTVRKQLIDSKILDGDILDFAVLECDCIDLIRINEAYGHEAGNEYLKHCCKFICDTYKHSPVYRIGGDEFVVLVSGIDYVERDERLACIREKVLMEYRRSGKEIDRIIFASGMAVFNPERDHSLDDVFGRADAEMYSNKTDLKNFLEKK